MYIQLKHKYSSAPVELNVEWDSEKNEHLKTSRGVFFEELLQHFVVSIRKHPARFGQKLLLIDYINYIWVIPFVENGNKIFLKTLFKSRRYTKLYREGIL